MPFMSTLQLVAIVVCIVALVVAFHRPSSKG